MKFSPHFGPHSGAVCSDRTNFLRQLFTANKTLSDATATLRQALSPSQGEEYGFDPR